MTVAPSPSMPIAMAMPPSDIKLAESPCAPMHSTAKSAQTGSDTATMNAARKFPRNRPRVMTTRTPPISKDSFTVHVASRTSSDWS